MVYLFALQIWFVTHLYVLEDLSSNKYGLSALQNIAFSNALNEEPWRVWMVSGLRLSRSIKPTSRNSSWYPSNKGNCLKFKGTSNSTVVSNGERLIWAFNVFLPIIWYVPPFDNKLSKGNTTNTEFCVVL